LVHELEEDEANVTLELLDTIAVELDGAMEEETTTRDDDNKADETELLDTA
jgi:hypothetical protein